MGRLSRTAPGSTTPKPLPQGASWNGRSLCIWDRTIAATGADGQALFRRCLQWEGEFLHLCSVQRRAPLSLASGTTFLLGSASSPRCILCLTTCTGSLSTCDLTAMCQHGHRAGPLRPVAIGPSDVDHQSGHLSSVAIYWLTALPLITRLALRSVGWLSPLSPRGLRVSPSWLLRVTSTGGPPAVWVRVGGLPEGLSPGLQESKVEVARPSHGSGLDPAQFSSLAVCRSKFSHRDGPGLPEGLDKRVDPRTPFPTATVQRLPSPPGTDYEIRLTFQEPHFLPE